ncbi:MAG: YbaN family protein [Candidatus Izemoplasmataceae bacterium]
MKIIYTVLGTLFLLIGFVGVILPILPTTPFLLLTLYFYTKGSDRFHDWFIDTKVYHQYLEDFVTTKSMTLKQKWTLMLFVDFMLLFPFIILEGASIKILIVVLIALKYFYFFTQVKTIKKDVSN